MKNLFSALLLLLLLACNNESGDKKESGNDSNSTADKKKEESLSSSSDGNCGNSLLFKKGVQIYATTYDGNGKEMNKGASTVLKVYKEGGMTISEVEMKSTGADPKAGDTKTFNALYKCDGKLMYIDMTSFLPDADKNMKMETTGLQFPFDVSVGETLPDAEYSVNMSRGGKTMKITSHITERKVEAKESVTTPAGTFDCYRISSVIEAKTEIPGMDERAKKAMEAMQKNMGKNKMIFWYAPDVTIIKMEFYMGNKLVTRNEVTEIKK